MNILVSWKDSLTSFVMGGFIEDIKAGKPLASLWRFIKYSLPLTFFAILLDSFFGYLGFSRSTFNFLNVIGFLVENIYLFLLLFLVFFAAKPIKKSFSTRWRYIPYIVFTCLTGIVFAFLVAGKNELFTKFISEDATKMFSFKDIINYGLLLNIKENMFHISFAPLYAFFVCFIFDSGLSLKSIGQSFVNALKMVIYTYPVCLILHAGLTWLYFEYYDFVRFALFIETSIFNKIVSESWAIKLSNASAEYLQYLIAVLVFSIFVGFYTNQRKKYPKLYK